MENRTELRWSPAIQKFLESRPALRKWLEKCPRLHRSLAMQVAVIGSTLPFVLASSSFVDLWPVWLVGERQTKSHGRCHSITALSKAACLRRDGLRHAGQVPRQRCLLQELADKSCLQIKSKFCTFSPISLKHSDTTMLRCLPDLQYTAIDMERLRSP